MSQVSRGDPAEPPDDVERLLARLEAPPLPPLLAARVRARTTASCPPHTDRWLALAVVGGLVAALLAAVSGYLTGRELVQSGAFELLRLAVEERELVAAAPGEYLLALAETVPWAGLLTTLACIAAAVASARPLARAPERLPAAGSTS